MGFAEGRWWHVKRGERGLALGWVRSSITTGMQLNFVDEQHNTIESNDTAQAVEAA